ncbi:MAG: NifU family protein [Nitrospinae bacterium]|nr:NifU family protein [Nitrospinota bacterium]
MKLSEVLKLQEEKKKPGAGTTGTGSPPSTSPANKKGLKVLRTRETPNPNALQFVLNAQILNHGNKSWSSKSDCGGDKMGEALFSIDGVDKVYIMENFVTVTKRNGVTWKPLSDRIWKAVDSHVDYYKTEGKEELAGIDVANYLSLSQDDIKKAVEMVLNRSVRSSLAQDGGGVDLKGIDGNVVQIHYQGACGDCASSTTGTLKYIERLIQQQLHSDLVVKSV